MLKVTATIVGVLAGFAALGVLALFIVKVVWAWTIPDILPGAVQQGLIVAELSWWGAFKLLLLLGVLLGGNSASCRSKN